jgi:hypothetical protein
LEKGRILRDSHRVQVDPQEDLEVEAFQEDLSDHQEVEPQVEVLEVEVLEVEVPEVEVPEVEDMAN